MHWGEVLLGWANADLRGWGGAIGRRAREGEVEAKTRKSSQRGSVSVAPIEMAAEGDVGRWWDSMDEVVVVVGLCVRKRETG